MVLVLLLLLHKNRRCVAKVVIPAYTSHVAVKHAVT